MGALVEGRVRIPALWIEISAVVVALLHAPTDTLLVNYPLAVREYRHSFQNVRASVAGSFARNVAQHGDFSRCVARVRVARGEPPDRQTERVADRACPG